MHSLTGFGMLAMWTGGATGQAVLSARAGLISYLEGAVYSDAEQLGSVAQLREGQRLRTEMGRAEVLLGIGAVLRLDEGASLRMENTQLTDTRVVVEHGSALVEVIELIEGYSNRHLFREHCVPEYRRRVRASWFVSLRRIPRPDAGLRGRGSGIGSASENAGQARTGHHSRRARWRFQNSI
jgi:hypothetical protein